MGYKHLKFPENSVFLVTGAAGFIGSNLCEAILNMGYKVKALDDLSTGKQENVDMFLDNPNYTFIKGDIKDLDTCMKACEGVDFVLNQAAWGSVPRSIEMPLFYCKNNIEGTLNMMEADDRMVLKNLCMRQAHLFMVTSRIFRNMREERATFFHPMRLQSVVTRNGASFIPSFTDLIHTE